MKSSYPGLKNFDGTPFIKKLTYPRPQKLEQLTKKKAKEEHIVGFIPFYAPNPNLKSVNKFIIIDYLSLAEIEELKWLLFQYRRIDRIYQLYDSNQIKIYNLATIRVLEKLMVLDEPIRNCYSCYSLEGDIRFNAKKYKLWIDSKLEYEKFQKERRKHEKHKNISSA